MNPKAISRVHLLGLIDPATREWTDGVLTKIARLVVSETGKENGISEISFFLQLSLFFIFSKCFSRDYILGGLRRRCRSRMDRSA